MKTLKTLGMALAALLAFGALSAAAATAYEWKVSGEQLTKSQSVSWTSTLSFEESYTRLDISCKLAYKGTVGPGKVGEITSITSTSGAKLIPCAVVEGGKYEYTTVDVEAAGLPWKTNLVVQEGELRDSVGGPASDWQITASGGPFGKETNSCLAESTTAVKNSSEGVEAAFDSKSPVTECVNGKGSVFHTSGTEQIATITGHLSVELPATEWLLNGGSLEKAVSVKSSGTLKFGDTNAPGGAISMECASASEASVGPGDEGEITHLTATGCKLVNKGVCETGAVVTAVDLPWHTALSTSESATRELISEDGKGAPGFKTECTTILGKAVDTCTGDTSAAVKTVSGGVDETFDAHAEKLKCTLGGTGTGTIEGTDLIENPPGDTLSFEEGL